MTNKNDVLVVGLFVNEAGAKEVANDIKEWDEWDRKDIELGAMAVLTIDPETGKLHSKEVGERTTKKGMGWGTAVGAAVGILSGGLALIPGMIIGGALGAGMGSLNHKSVGVTDEQYDKLIEALKHGGAALAIMADDFEVEAVVAKLQSEGANVDHYNLPDETAEAITATAAAQAEASEAVDAAADDVDEADVAEASKAVEVEVPEMEPEHAEHVSKLVAATGMSAADAAKFHDAGVEKASNFLAMAATPEGRAQLTEETGVESEVILYEAKKLDLMRIKGVGHKYASLMLAAGVDTVPELARRNAANLTAKCAEVNEKEQIVEELPSEKVVSDWIAQAKEMPRMLYY